MTYSEAKNEEHNLELVTHLAVGHRVQKTGKSRSLKKFGYRQDNALLFRPNCCLLSCPLVTVLTFSLEYTVPLV